MPPEAAPLPDRTDGDVGSGGRDGERAPVLRVAPSVGAPAADDRWWGRHLAETRWMLELARLLGDPALLSGAGVPRGDGRPVVLMPGLFAGDQTLAVLALWLRRIGYRASTCGFVANVNCSDRAMEQVDRRVQSLFRRHGRRVALVGHSRGGHYARALAAASPDRVSHAVSLGADLQTLLGISVPTRYAVSAIRRSLIVTGRAPRPQCFTTDCRCHFMCSYESPFPTDQVRLTSIYSKGDGVVRWERQIVPEADCVEVTGSHVGLVFNRAAYVTIAHALAAPEFPVAALN